MSVTEKRTCRNKVFKCCRKTAIFSCSKNCLVPDMKEMAVATYIPPVSPVAMFLEPRNIYKISNKAVKSSPEEA